VERLQFVSFFSWGAPPKADDFFIPRKFEKLLTTSSVFAIPP
jgi:hypothetical protein